MTENTKIVRGYYLTALGQEPLAYYFKITDDFPGFEVVKSGDVALTFYQNSEAITCIPALIRVDSIIEVETQVLRFLKSEKRDSVPMLPLVSIYEHFDPLGFNRMEEVFDKLKSEMKRLTNVTYIQGDLFEFLEDEK